jgi:hypothetical protein
MKVLFVVDYRGELTAEQFFRAGDEAEFNDLWALQLIADGRAVEVIEVPGEELEMEGEPHEGEQIGGPLPPQGDEVELPIVPANGDAEEAVSAEGAAGTVSTAASPSAGEGEAEPRPRGRPKKA